MVLYEIGWILAVTPITAYPGEFNWLKCPLPTTPSAPDTA